MLVEKSTLRRRFVRIAEARFRAEPSRSHASMLRWRRLRPGLWGSGLLYGSRWGVSLEPPDTSNAHVAT